MKYFAQLDRILKNNNLIGAILFFNALTYDEQFNYLLYLDRYDYSLGLENNFIAETLKLSFYKKYRF